MKWLADENFRNAIVRGIWRRSPGFDVVRVQDVAEIAGAEDSIVLAWATNYDRVFLTHDVSTTVPAMRRQIQQTGRCTPLVLVPKLLPIRQAIEDTLLLDTSAVESDWAAGVLYLPLQ